MLKPAILRQAVWKNGMETKFPLLTKIALRLLYLPATSCSTDGVGPFRGSPAETTGSAVD